jgi:hypothetical protein
MLPAAGGRGNAITRAGDDAERGSDHGEVLSSICQRMTAGSTYRPADGIGMRRSIPAIRSALTRWFAPREAENRALIGSS